ncbi:MAG: glutamate 5-kinase [Chitinophagaceae bacterium]
MPSSYKKLVIKIGSNVLAKKDGLPDLERMFQLTNEIASLKKEGRQVIVVSSGAVAAGKSLIKVTGKYDVVSARQLLASVGQVQLINNYADLFKTHNLICSQVLVTKDDFRDRLHYRNMLNCFDILLQHDIIPVVNENDVISITELMFTDNDELAGLIASMIKADALIILTNVDGLYNGDPNDPGSTIIEEIDPSITDFTAFVTTKKSNFGRGGMLTKSQMANKIAQLGIAVHIANGTREGILRKIMENKTIHTKFLPFKGVSGKKRWIAHTDKYSKGLVRINDGARKALTGNKASSLLPVGIMEVKGEFKKKDIITIIDEEGKMIGLGIAEYGSDKAMDLVGQKNQKPLVHYNYLYLSQENH